MSCSCCSGLQALFSRAPGAGGKGRGDEREKFEKIIRFLASVPIFRKQLPAKDLPGLASRLVEKSWAPGTTLIKEGETGKTFFLIFSGEASVMTQVSPGEVEEHAVLCEGDWLGGHTLTSERPNVATIIAKGPEPLVTLGLTKRDFEEAGLKAKLTFPKRPAMRIHDDGVDKAFGDTVHRTEATGDLSNEEVDFIVGAISRNQNMHPYIVSGAGGGGSNSEELRDLARLAERREISAGTEVARFGDLGQEFFVIRSGTFEVVCDPSATLHGRAKRSAEEAVSSASVVERMKRKQHFLQQLHEPIDRSDRRMTHSVLIKDPRDMRNKSSGFRVQSLRDTQSLEKRKNPGGRPQGPYVAEELESGDSFGELSLMYNTRREATFVACTKAVVYVISRRKFKQVTNRINESKHFHDCAELLDEVELLTPLLRSERHELAANYIDWITFPPGQRILVHGQVRTSPVWYIIMSGSAVVSDLCDGGPGQRTRLQDSAMDNITLLRAQHFGGKSLRKVAGKPSAALANVDAGPSGLTCVTFDGELVRELFAGLERLGSETNMDQDYSIPLVTQCKSIQNCQSCELHQVHEVCLLGRGGFGTVFLVEVPQASKKLYALKRISKGLAQREDTVQQLRWERDLLSMLESPFIIRLFRTFKDAEYVYLLLEVALGSDLYMIFNQYSEIFTEDRPRGSATAFYVACITAGLDHLHERRIIYRDIKPENVLLDERGYGKLCDMGLARFVFGKTSTQVGTPDYMAPEMIDPPHFHGLSADWWALGVLTFELLNRRTPFDDNGLDDPHERLLAIRRSQEQDGLMFQYDCPGIARTFIDRLLRKLPNRLGAVGGATAIRTHPWFRKFDFDALHGQTLLSPMKFPWTMPENPEVGGLGGPVKPKDDLFVPFEDDGSEWDAAF